MPMMDRIGGREEEEGEQEHWVGPKIRSEHVDLHESCGMQFERPHATLQDLQI